MINVFLSHEVKDFAVWQAGFSADDANRKKAGVNVLDLYVSAENPNMVTIISEFPNVDVLNGFMSNPDLIANMERLGVIGVPEVKVMKKLSL